MFLNTLRNPGSRESFSKEDTLVIKGIAIIAMIWHHCFLAGRADGYDVSFWPLSQTTVEEIASFLKICVSLFAFVSGYGLYSSLEKEYNIDRESAKTTVKWIKSRYIRTFSGYWFILILSWIVTFLIDKKPYKIYFEDSILSGIFNMAIEFAGVSRLFETPMMLGPWWYMSAAFVFIVTAPLTFYLLERFGGLACLAVIMIIPRVGGAEFPGGMDFYSFFPVFLLGMIFAKYSFFEQLDTFIKCNIPKYIAVVVISLIGTFLCYRLDRILPTSQFWDFKWGLFPCIYIVCVYFSLCRILVVRNCLAFLGRNSANAFLIHNFIRAVYLRDFTYSHGNFILVIVCLLGISVVISILIDALKKVLHYNEFVERVLINNG